MNNNINDYVLKYPEYDLIVRGKIIRDTILIDKSELPNRRFPNGCDMMYFEGKLYKAISLDVSQIIYIIIAIIYILLAIFIIIYSYMSSCDISYINSFQV